MWTIPEPAAESNPDESGRRLARQAAAGLHSARYETGGQPALACGGRHRQARDGGDAALTRRGRARAGRQRDDLDRGHRAAAGHDHRRPLHAERQGPLSRRRPVPRLRRRFAERARLGAMAAIRGLRGAGRGQLSGPGPAQPVRGLAPALARGARRRCLCRRREAPVDGRRRWRPDRGHGLLARGQHGARGVAHSAEASGREAAGADRALSRLRQPGASPARRGAAPHPGRGQG